MTGLVEFEAQNALAGLELENFENFENFKSFKSFKSFKNVRNYGNSKICEEL